MKKGEKMNFYTVFTTHHKINIKLVFCISKYEIQKTYIDKTKIYGLLSAWKISIREAFSKKTKRRYIDLSQIGGTPRPFSKHWQFLFYFRFISLAIFFLFFFYFLFFSFLLFSFILFYFILFDLI